jgi:hypothetical protein
MVERLDLRPPSILKQTLEKLRIREVAPVDICPDGQTLAGLYEVYPDLAGDVTAIGVGDDGGCQSWRGCFGWWKEVVKET